MENDELAARCVAEIAEDSCFTKGRLRDEFRMKPVPGLRLSVLSRFNSTSGQLTRKVHIWLSQIPLFRDTETTGSGNHKEARGESLPSSQFRSVYTNIIIVTCSINHRLNTSFLMLFTVLQRGIPYPFFKGCNKIC